MRSMYRPSVFSTVRGMFIPRRYEDMYGVVLRVIATLVWIGVCIVVTALIIHPESTPYQVNWAFGGFISLFALVCWFGGIWAVWYQYDSSKENIVKTAQHEDLPPYISRIDYRYDY
jgi:hypothetical protein